MADAPAPFDAFKAPLLKQESELPIENNSSQKVTDENKGTASKTTNKGDKPQVAVPLPYKEPEWSGNPPYNYSFEVIKNGTLISTFKINSSLLTFGRLQVCDFVFEHPSVSRYHAIVQYCKGDDSHPKGFYLYDLGSTHSTFLNKQPVKPKIYYKLKVGYILKFGGSSRLHIFQGPEEDEEVETKKSEEKNVDVCTWGMGEDAEEEEDGGINPFAATANEELYLEDPKKTLRGWFEREGYELEYKVEEKGYQTFMCCIKLPIDTPTGEFMPVEATVSGKKKEAVVACALEACRTLDRLGLLRQSHHESRQRKKKKWEENDYYDSDEDEYYDRTGEIERRREMRKRLVKKNKTENLDSIQKRLKAVVDEIKEIQVKFDACDAAEALAAKEGDEDSLDMYMSNLSKSANAPKDKFEQRKMMLRMSELQKEIRQLEKMLKILLPTKLPPCVAKRPGVLGKRPKSKLQLPVAKPEEPATSKDTNEEEIEEDESDSEAPVADKKVKTSAEPEAKDSDDHQVTKDEAPVVEMEIKVSSELNDSKDCLDKAKGEAPVVEKKVPVSLEANDKEDTLVNAKGKKYGLLLTVGDEREEPEKIVFEEEAMEENESETISHPSDDTADKEETDEKMDVEQMHPTVKSAKRNRPRKDKKAVDVYKTDTTEYCTWTPPTGQSGDGMTHLNAKFGY